MKKTRRPLILALLICSCFALSPLFSQEKDALREARKLRSEAAYLEMKGATEQAIQCYEKSLQYLPDPKIEEKIQSLRNPPIQPDVGKTPDAPMDTEQQTAEADPGSAESPSKPIESIPGPEPVSEPYLPMSPEAQKAFAEFQIPAECSAGIHLQALNSIYTAELALVADESTARAVVEKWSEELRCQVWDDEEAALKLFQVYLQAFPDSESPEETKSEILLLADRCQDWNTAIQYQTGKLESAKLENNTFHILDASLQLIRYLLLNGDEQGVATVMHDIQALDPDTRYEQSYTVTFIARHLPELLAQIQEPDRAKPAENPTDARKLYREMVRWHYFINTSDEFWNLADADIEHIQQLGIKLARKIVEQCTPGYLHSRAILYLLQEGSDALLSAQDRLQWMQQFVKNYGFDDKADSVRRQLIEALVEQGDLAAAAQVRESLIWEDVDTIDSDVEEYYRAIEIAKAWERAENWSVAKQWYETALNLDQYGEWSKTKDLEAALATILTKLPTAPEEVLPILSTEEQETLATEILAQLVELDQDQVREFEKGYLTIIERCPDVPQVDVAYFRIGNLYRLAYDTPKNDKLIPLYEQFLKKYPNSEGIPHVANILTLCLSEVEDWKRLIEVEAHYFLRKLSQEPDDQEIARYSLHADHLLKAGRQDDAVRWYKRVWVSDPDQHTFSAQIAQESLANLGYADPEALQALPAATAYE